MSKAWTIPLATLAVTLVLGSAWAFAEEKPTETAQPPQVMKPADLGGRWTGTLTRRSTAGTFQSKLALEVPAAEPTKGRFAIVNADQTRGTWETPIELRKEGGVRMDMGIHGYQLFTIERKDGAMILKTFFHNTVFRGISSDYTVILEKEK